MYEEAARLMRRHFWVEDMAGIDWDAVVARYRPLAERVATRDELHDLIWELHGELGTSHAYVMADRPGRRRPNGWGTSVPTYGATPTDAGGSRAYRRQSRRCRVTQSP